MFWSSKKQPQAKETIEFLEWSFDIADATVASKKDDGKITLRDSANYFSALLKTPVAVGGIELVPRELAQLGAEACKEVVEYFIERFDLPDDELEARIEKTLQTGHAFAESVLELTSNRKRA